MPVSRVLLSVLAGFLACLYLYDACFGEGGASVPSAGAVLAHRWPDAVEFRPTVEAASAPPTDTTPAARVREPFAMFMPSDDRGALRPLPAPAKPQG